ncbi:AAA family ATPase [Schumannella sp. 10F1B-5-1]|uniref:AAA family ATPase n=1 Tax=Schumannella sp. 10F1B-5-1 TaxID=2590780 RepID=UPI001131D087|nr:AAA family ATPase [Schumannella sp. 10F1B-5-1]TPW76685.1 AAA family ATPase [Schumannella sp. 10F1B-5-1]
MATRLIAQDRAVLTVAADNPDCHQTIASALASANDGDVISIRPGVYRESVTIDRAVSLSGVGDAGEVRIEGPSGPAVRSAAVDVRVSGVTLARAEGDVAVDVESGAVSLDDCTIEASTEVAVVVRAEALLTMHDSAVANAGGAGVLVYEGGKTEISGGRLHDIATTALVVRGPSSARVADLDVQTAQGGLLAADGAQLSLVRGTIGTIANAAITIEGGASLDAAGTVVADGEGIGLLVTTGGSASLADVTLRRLGGQGVVGMADARIELAGVTIEHGATHALHLIDGARLTAERCELRSAGHDAVVVAGTASLALADSTIERPAGTGATASDEATVTFTNVRIVDAEGEAAVARDTARFVVEGGAVRGGRLGFAWEDSATGALRGTRIRDVDGEAVRVDPDADVEVDRREGDQDDEQDGAPATPQTSAEPARADAAEPGPSGESELDRMLAELDQLVGLDSVKRQVETLVRMHQMAERRAEAGLPSPPVSRHLVFAGSPGTGKTTVARLYGRILAALGVVRTGQLVEVARPDLVAAVIGGTAIKTAEMFQKALGGVLFIDEAYALSKDSGSSNDFGGEAIDTLVKLMEDHRDDVVVIVAGYTNDMRTFMAANPGLSSRFSRTIEFTDYSSAEMVTIVEGLCSANHYSLEFETRAALHDYFTKLPRDETFGNGRTARKVFEEMLGRQAYRLGNADAVDALTLTRLVPDDLGPLPGSSIGAGVGRVDEERVDQLLGTLRELVGLDDVKAEVEGMVDLLTSARRRQAAGLPAPSLSRHLIFAGPPGTGKTTVARLYGSLLTALGVLAQGQVTEVSRADLVGEYVGHTARRTTEAFDRARGGVLFIDEAYTLASGGGSGADFGKESVDTLVKLMEDHRDEVVVIAAGYEREMDQFLATNPGLDSRFSHRVRFANYTPDELVTIVNQHATGSGYECTGPTVAALRGHFTAVDRTASFGNGRYARQVMDAAIANHARRTRGIEDPTMDDLVLLLPEDVPSPEAIGA